MKKYWITLGVVILVPLLLAGGVYLYDRHIGEVPFADIEALLGTDEDIPPAKPIPTTPQEVAQQPKDTSALGGYNMLIADRGNNRVIEVTPDKQIVWEYDFHGLPGPGYGADDSFFADNGKTIIVNLERYHILEQIDYQTKQVMWRYGTSGVHGSGPGHLYSPDDAYKLPNGNVSVADIKNCRILEISPDKKVIQQFGKTRQCLSKPGYLDAPNGDTPLPNGDLLVSTILDHSVTELDPNGNTVFSMVLPLKYPSDPQLMRNGDILVAEYKDPGKIIEITKQGSVVWEYDAENGVPLKDPSLAIELPNGNILANDDLNHRVVVIDKQTKQIIWQFGVTGKPGDGANQLNIPDGLDIILPSAQPQVQAQATSTYAVGAITRHAAQYIGKQLTIRGYLLKREAGYVIVSDEPGGQIGIYDLPVTGMGTDTLMANHLYTMNGIFYGSGLSASNGNPDHFELSTAPVLVK